MGTPFSTQKRGERFTPRHGGGSTDLQGSSQWQTNSSSKRSVLHSFGHILKDTSTAVADSGRKILHVSEDGRHLSSGLMAAVGQSGR